MIIPIRNFDLLSVAFVIAAMIILGFVVFLQNKKSVTNRTFFYLSIVVVLWSVVNYASYQFQSYIITLWLTRFIMFFAVWFALEVFSFLYVFPEENKNFPKWYKYIFIPLTITTSIACLTPLVFKNIKEVLSVGNPHEVEIGPGMILFVISVVIFNLGGIIYFFIKTLKSSTREKSRYKYIFIGIFITIVLILFFNFILPSFFNNPLFIPLAALFVFPFIACTAYAIIRHKLFNVRVIGVGMLVFLLSIVSFIEVIQTNDFLLILYRITVFLFVLIFGILLIRGVLKEVQQREEIAKMAEDVRRAYVIEKKAKEELEKLDKVKDQFVMTTQHNLRTPLTSMMGYSDLLLNGTFGKQNKKTTEVIKKFETLVQSMIRMVNDFLDMAQFQLGKEVVSLRPRVEVLPMLDEIINELKFKADSRSLSLTLEKPEKVFFIKADREKLKAALFNIVDNAIKYTEKGGVTIKLENHDTVKILISDTGIGIAKEKLGGMFNQMFERAERARKISSVGSGIGLFLSGQIIKSHNGKVWAESEGEGKGSTFHIELPIDDGPANAPVTQNKVSDDDATPVVQNTVPAAQNSTPVAQNSAPPKTP